MLSRMSSLSALVELVRNVLGVFIDALSFFRLALRSPSALAAENLFLRKQLGLYIDARGPIERSQALAIARQIAEAMQTAHGHGIIHRDLKPANVKVKADGTVKVLD